MRNSIVPWRLKGAKENERLARDFLKSTSFFNAVREKPARQESSRNWTIVNC
jgi:hypothetical protein